MKKSIWLGLIICFLYIPIPQAVLAGKGFMGGKGDIVISEEPSDDDGMPSSVEGPLNDNMSTSGALYGDLYKILRHLGGETYTAYIFTYDDVGRITGVAPNSEAKAIGGAPVLSESYGYYAAEVINGEEVTYELATSPYPSQCVQPVADFEKWGDISKKTGLTQNRLPLVITYDATWTLSECEVGKLDGLPEVNNNTGEMTLTINNYFIPKCDNLDEDPEQCTWNGVVYCDGVLWADLVDEVHFGRLNLSRAPEAVLQAAFDEAISAINKAKVISRDSAGRLLLTTDVYEEIPTSVDGTCEYAFVETVTKAIDSPLENLALYVKLMKDGHLITPGDEREPIDRSAQGGMPLWKMLELEDGPSADLRPTIDINKLKAFLPNLVDITPEQYYTYYTCIDGNGVPVEPCMVWTTDVMQPELEGKWVMDPDVVSRELQVVSTCPVGIECEGPFSGLMTDGDATCDAADLDFAAAFLAAAAPKYESIGPDLVVYLNSVLGINKVIGLSEDGLTDYSKSPEYFNYSVITAYDRKSQFDARSQPTILRSQGDGVWQETEVQLMDTVQFKNLGVDQEWRSPTGQPATKDFMGFTQMADDNLSIIKLTHTYQIPGLR